MALAAALIFLAATAPALERLSPEAFLDLAVGRTLTFLDLRSGQVAGVEEYLSRDLSVWVQPNGRCVYGDITIEEGKLCFLYRDSEDNKQCWWPFRDGERLYVRFARGLAGSIQEVVRISDETLSCPEVPSV